MNIHAIKENERAKRLVVNVLKRYDGVFNLTEDSTAKEMIAADVVKSLKRNKLMKTYRS